MPAARTARNPRSILIVKPSSLGDVVHTLPAVARIRRHWPGAKISWLVNPEWAPILADNPGLDEVIEFPRNSFRGLFGWMRLPAWVRTLKARVQPDLVLDFQGLLRSALIARGTGGETWGTSDSREGARLFHHHVVPVPDRGEPIHAVTRCLALAAALGCDGTAPLAWPLPEGSPPAGIPSHFVLLHPFSRGAGKSLTLSDIRSFSEQLAPTRVVVAGRSDSAIEPAENTLDLLNRTSLAELCWLARHAQFVVSTDSGPMHIASALTPNLLAIHTWSDPRKVGPFRPEAFVWKDGIIGPMAEFPGGIPCPLPKIGQWLGARLPTRRQTD